MSVKIEANDINKIIIEYVTGNEEMSFEYHPGARYNERMTITRDCVEYKITRFLNDGIVENSWEYKSTIESFNSVIQEIIKHALIMASIYEDNSYLDIVPVVVTVYYGSNGRKEMFFYRENKELFYMLKYIKEVIPAVEKEPEFFCYI